jgi:putative phage-type endonuclease
MIFVAERKIGATDAAKLLHVSKYGGPLDVYQRIVDGKVAKTNKAMERGTKYEPEVMRRYLADNHETLQEMPKPCIVQHPRLAMVTASPDGITRSGRLVELKTASRFAKGWQHGPPVDYSLQVAWQMWVCEFPSVYLYVAFGTDEKDGSFTIGWEQQYFAERDREIEEQFEEVAVTFWEQHVVKKIPPQGETA